MTITEREDCILIILRLPIDRNSECFRLITRIQDEAHRFAITFHRQLRSKGQVHSVPGRYSGSRPCKKKRSDAVL